jgi:hypothetical protein
MPEVSVVHSDNKRFSKKTLIIGILVILVAGVIAAVLLVQNSQQANIKACDCTKYSFLVTSTGSVTVTNSQTISEPAQQATVTIDGSPAGTFDVPALDPGQSQTLGTVNVPGGNFTWSVVGSKYCHGSGGYQAPSATPTPSPTETPSPTPPEISETPIITPTEIPTPTPLLPTVTPVTTPIPTVTPLITQVPTATPNPTATPTSNPPDNPPSPPNRCNGDCHSDDNCGYGEDGVKLVCVNNFCRQPSCTDQISCHCPPPISTGQPTPTTTQTLVRTGDASTTIAMTIGGLLLIGLGTLLAL